MLATGYVGRELITILTAVATHIALKWVAEAVATHVDGEHDVVQENHPAVATRIHGPGHCSGLAISPCCPQSLQRRQGDGLGVRVRVREAILVV